MTCARRLHILIIAVVIGLSLLAGFGQANATEDTPGVASADLSAVPNAPSTLVYLQRTPWNIKVENLLRQRSKDSDSGRDKEQASNLGLSS
jgi:hypothetical protein